MRRPLPPLLVLLCVAGPLAAAPADPAGPPSPAVVVRVKPLADIASDLKALTPALELPFGGPVDLDNLFAPFLGDDWEKAVDTSKPLGMVGTPDANPLNSTAVFLVPVKDEKRVVKFLERFEASEDGGVHTFTPPDWVVPLHLKFVGGYAAISVLHPTALDKTRLGLPTDLLKGDRPAGWLSVTVDGDRVPKKLRELALDQIDTMGKWQPPANGLPQLGAMIRLYQDFGVEFGTLLARDTHKASLDIDFDHKTGQVSVDFVLTPLPKSPLAARIAADPKTLSRTAGLLRTGDAVQYASAMVYPESYNRLINGLTAIMNDEKFNPDAKSRAMTRLSAALNEAVDGRPDFASALRGPDKDGRFTVFAAYALKDTPKLEKTFRAWLEDAPDDAKAALKGLKFADKADADGLRLHTIALPDEPTTEPARKLFGDGPALLGAYPDMLVLAYGPEAKAIIREAKSLKPVAGSMTRVEADPAAIAAMLKEFGIPAKGEKGRVKLLVLEGEGGERLHFRARADILGIVRLARLRDGE